jgi:hypothetical protein
MSPHLRALVDCVTELHEAGLEACHCAEEFILQWIRLLGRREQPAFECPRFSDPNCNPLVGKLSFLI